QVAESENPSGERQSEIPVELNPLALQIAGQFRDENTSPALLIGQLRLLDFVSLLAINLLSVILMGPAENVGLALQFGSAALGAGVTVFLLQRAAAYQIPFLRAARRSRRRLFVASLAGLCACALALHMAGDASHKPAG